MARINDLRHDLISKKEFDSFHFGKYCICVAALVYVSPFKENFGDRVPVLNVAAENLMHK